jgi:hypothetical protein
MQNWAKAHPAATTEQRDAAATRYRGYFFTPKHIGYFAQVRITRELSQRDDLNPAFDLKDWSRRKATEVLVDAMKNEIAERDSPDVRALKELMENAEKRQSKNLDQFLIPTRA